MLRYLTAGESHGKFLTTVLEGTPSGLAVDIDFINSELQRRQQGFGRSERMKIELDTVKITSGLRKGFTIGSPIAFTIQNKDFTIEKLPEVRRPRPGHADLAGITKFSRKDVRDVLERASARETASRVGVGAFAKLFLKQFDIDVISYTVNLGGVRADMTNFSLSEILDSKKRSELNCADPVMEAEMVKLIKKAIEEKDTLGGIFEVVITNVPPGLGSYTQWDKKLDGRLARAIMSIQAVKGVEVGLGFMLATLRGSEVHDEIYYDPNREGYRFYRKTNNAGGIEGGMSNGEDIILRAVMKPIATLGSPLKSVDIKTKKPSEGAYERADVTAVPSVGVIGEAVAAFEIADAFLEKFGGDSMTEVRRNYDGYMKQISEM